MEKDHLRAKTLENIVQTRDVTAKIETQNFGNQRIYYGTSRQVRLSSHLHFFIRFVLYEIKITKTIFLAMEINSFSNSARQNSGNWKLN